MGPLELALGEASHRHPMEQASRFDLAQDRADAHRRFDITSLANMMDIMLIVNHQSDLPLNWMWPFTRRLGKILFAVAKLAQFDRVVEGIDHQIDVGLRAKMRILALEDRSNDLTDACRRQLNILTKIVED